MRGIVVDSPHVLMGNLNPALRKPRRYRVRRLAAWTAVIVLTGLLWAWWHRRLPVPATEIYQGITYGCDRLPADEECYGLVHWVKVDLTAPGIELYVTPMDPVAQAHGWQYCLRTTGNAVREEKLAVGINATYHGSDSGWLPLPGDFARSSEAVIEEYHVSHIPQYTYLLWFSENLMPSIETTRPPRDAVLRQARWGLGGRGAVLLQHGQILSDSPLTPIDARTAVGVNAEQHLLILAAFQNSSPRRALEKLVDLGATDGMLLDGGNSTSMALGDEAWGVRTGVLLGDWRPVATHFGVRARPFPSP